MIGGGALAAAGSLGFTDLAATRGVDITAAEDEEAIVSLRGFTGDGTTYARPQAVSITNDSGQELETVTVETDGSAELEAIRPQETERTTVEFGNVPDGGSRIVSLINAFDVESIDLDADFGGSTLALARAFELDDVGLVAWYDAGIEQYVSANGSVTEWPDREGAGPSLSAVEGDPQYLEDDPFAAVRFDGDDGLGGATAELTTDNELTAFVVYDGTNGGGNVLTLLAEEADEPFLEVELTDTGVGDADLTVETAGENIERETEELEGAVGDRPAIVGVTLRGDGDTLEIEASYVEGDFTESPAAFDDLPASVKRPESDFPNADVGVGARFNSDSDSFDSHAAAVDVHELLVFDRALERSEGVTTDDDDTGAIFDYLRRRWGPLTE